jgi:hypothetical protein
MKLIGGVQFPLVQTRRVLDLIGNIYCLVVCRRLSETLHGVWQQTPYRLGKTNIRLVLKLLVHAQFVRWRLKIITTRSFGAHARELYMTMPKVWRLLNMYITLNTRKEWLLHALPRMDDIERCMMLMTLLEVLACS